MTDLDAARWAAFTDGEREVLRHGLRDSIVSILAAAAGDQIEQENLAGAAGTLLLCQRMDFELDEAEDIAHPELATPPLTRPELDMVTVELIASGGYPEAVRELLAGQA